MCKFKWPIKTCEKNLPGVGYSAEAGEIIANNKDFFEELQKTYKYY